MKIEEKLINKLHEWEKTSDNLIYLVNLEIEIVKIKTLKKGKVKEVRNVYLFGELWENNPGEPNKEYFTNKLEAMCDVKDKETMEIKKVILIKEIACSSYKR